MALLLETTLGDLVIDLDLEGSPELCKNILKLAKARYYTSTLIYNVHANRFCQLGDPNGDGTGGACIHGLIASENNPKDSDVTQSLQRFLKSGMGRPLTATECQEKGRVVATEMSGIPDTIGSQFLITTSDGPDRALDGFSITSTKEGSDADRQTFRSIGIIREDESNILDQIAGAYCDADGRPYADIRVLRALVIDDPFDDPASMDRLLEKRGVILDDEDRVTASPQHERPPEESVEVRIQADQVDPLNGEEDAEKTRQQEEELLHREDKSRAVVLEMLGDLPSAEIQAPENVLFVCKLNPVTEDEDLELIFSRFDEKVKAEIIRDPETGNSLQFAFVEFSAKKQAVEAYFKMNNTLVDDRRIKVDFSQSVSKVWDKYNQRMRQPQGQGADRRGGLPPVNGTSGTNNVNNSHAGDRRDGGRGGRGRGRGGPDRDFSGRGRGGRQGPQDRRMRENGGPNTGRGGNAPRPPPRDRMDEFGRERHWGPPPQQSRQGNGRGESDRDVDELRNEKAHREERSNRETRERQRHDSDDENRDRSLPRDKKMQRNPSRSRSRSRERRDSKHKKHDKRHKHSSHHDDRERRSHRRDRDEDAKSKDKSRRRHELHDSDDDGGRKHDKHDKDDVDKDGKRHKRDDRSRREDRSHRSESLDDSRTHKRHRDESRRERRHRNDDDKGDDRRKRRHEDDSGNSQRHRQQEKYPSDDDNHDERRRSRKRDKTRPEGNRSRGQRDEDRHRRSRSRSAS
jgi:peptidyl-prolyl cis-trans isomerase-like 4